MSAHFDCDPVRLASHSLPISSHCCRSSFTMAPSFSAVCTLLVLGTSAAFVVPSPNCLSRGAIGSRCVASPATRQQRMSPLRMGSDSEEVLSKVRTIVAQQLAVEESQVVPAASFTQDLGADSLDTVELIMALEEGFNIEIEDEVAAEISTVQNAVDFIVKQ